ncbi:hypothetical protein HDV00_002251 [Rhizophlyctis rosea]|nr:hypothetical protein HDV00_002251 [Rhizophlyctis rosea]
MYVPQPTEEQRSYAPAGPRVENLPPVQSYVVNPPVQTQEHHATPEPPQIINTPYPLPPQGSTHPPDATFRDTDGENTLQRKSSLASLKGAPTQRGKGVNRGSSMADVVGTLGRAKSVVSRIETVKKKPITLVATAGRDLAIQRCQEKVSQISKECKERNVRFRDTHFDVDNQNSLYALDTQDDIVYRTAGTKRVWEIFDDPKFFVNGTTAGDIQQGAAGDCYFLAALATVTNVPTLLSQLCVARDEEVGVYGFIFFKDGDWTSVVVDDLLYTRAADYGNADPVLRSLLRHDETLYRKLFQTGSDALFFSACKDKNETWLPLLEKAYAKVHGDYESIDGGLTGEAVEDLTGGVTTTLYCKDILDQDRFWREELVLVNQQYLFAVGIVEKKRPAPAPAPSDGSAPTPGASPSNPDGEKISHNGLVPGHAYSILRAVEKNGKRFVLIRNPWGKTEWNGKWSDGSAEWTPEWMIALNHRFGDDGIFWMEYPDFLRQWTLIDRTRLFDSSYTVASQWVRLPAFWPAQWSSTVFSLTISHATPATIVLSQLDTRYFRGLAGQYDFFMEIRVTDARNGEVIARSRGLMHMRRSSNVEIRRLEEGVYIVHVKVTRIRVPDRKTVVDAVMQGVGNRPEKTLAVSENYVVARAKAGAESEGIFRALGLGGVNGMDGASRPAPTPAIAPQQEGGEGGEAEEEGDYICDGCKRTLGGTRYHCTDCADYDLCPDCYEKVAEIHGEEGHEFEQREESPAEYQQQGGEEEQQQAPAPAGGSPDDDDDTPTVVCGLRVYALDPELRIGAHIGGELELVVGVDPEDAHGDSKLEADDDVVGGVGGGPGGMVGFAGARPGEAKQFGGEKGKLGPKEPSKVQKQGWTKH